MNTEQGNYFFTGYQFSYNNQFFFLIGECLMITAHAFPNEVDKCPIQCLPSFISAQNQKLLTQMWRGHTTKIVALCITISQGSDISHFVSHVFTSPYGHMYSMNG